MLENSQENYLHGSHKSRGHFAVSFAKTNEIDNLIVDKDITGLPHGKVKRVTITEEFH